MSRVPGTFKPTKPIDIMQCPFAAEHVLPNGRKMPRFNLGGTGTWDTDNEAQPDVTFRCVLGHEWRPSDLIR